MTCRNCGGYVDPNSKFCMGCGAPTVPQKKKKKKAPFIIIAIVLVLAIIAGGVAVFAMTSSNPHIKVFNAAKNTVFNSSEYTITAKFNYDDGDYETCDISLFLGEDIDSSTFEAKFNEHYTYDGETYIENEGIYSIEDGQVYYDGDYEYDVKDLLREAEEELAYYSSTDVDLEDEINNIINGKIDEAALESAYNSIISSILEDMIKEETGESVDLPEYDDVFGTATSLFKDKAVREAVTLEKIKSDLPGTTYEYNIDFGKLAEAVLDYATEDEQYVTYLETAADYMGYTVDELVDELVDEIGDINDISGTITIKSNRITNVYIELPYDEDTIEITVESK